jgi:FKBP-type peptidyl-prolyl cis-trans isomerase
MSKLANPLMGCFVIGIFCAASAFAQQQAPGAGTAAPSMAAPAAKSTASGQSAGTSKTGQAAATKKPPTAAPLTTDKQKASYAIGENIGKGLQKDGVDVDTATLMRGIRDGISGAKPALSDEEAKAALTKLATDVRAKQQAKFDALSAANKKQGDDFLAANKEKDGVTTLPSGLQYKVLTEGTGPKPAATDKVVCNYRGTLVSGTEFDSSYKRGQPATFPVNGVIKGWTEALQLMPVGSKWELFVPPDLAYGPRGSGQAIGPNSTLIFEVELLSIAPKAEAPKPEAAKPDAAKPDAPKPEAAKPQTK